ncbi:MAG: tRNA preQ1(34) S-adenosylmethionine ribosyltransferase-isomerase QueA [Actinomycetota bacterium]|nr:tRNA preQ1(34) S-adenosylmethionine ribosyltransferase-isomerase QueA [Actinomycetota bacterium]
MDASLFTYDLPGTAIAQSAIEPRDAARLLVADTLEDQLFTDLPSLLDPGDLVVVNNTRVRPARVRATKETGGAVEVLLTKRIDEARWEALVRPARRIRPGTRMSAGSLQMTVLAGPDRGVVTVEIIADVDVDDVLPGLGEVPLPPYFHGALENDERYQTMFARVAGSAAAPTAALHFTPAIVDALQARGVRIAEVELDVGLDTFRPMADGPISDHQMHLERYSIPTSTVEQVAAAKTRGSRVVAIGTTVVRTLETAADGDGRLQADSGSTDLFITPGYQPKIVDAMVTNFHAPGTTLIVMIAALLGSGWRDVYDHALEAGYRFLSFGDAMFIEVQP